MNCLKLQEEEAQHFANNPQKQGLTTVVYKGLMKAHSKYRDRLTRELEEDDELTLMLQTQHNGTILSSQLLMPDEQDIECPDEKIERQLNMSQKTNMKLLKILQTLDPIIHDLREGNLKRVAKSTFQRKPRKSKGELLSEQNITDSDEDISEKSKRELTSRQ